MSKQEQQPEPIDPMAEPEVDHEAAIRAAQTAEQDSIEKIREYATPVGVGVALALAAYLGYTAWQYSQHKSSEQASSLYAQADTAEELQELVEAYPKSSVAPRALLTLASREFHEGQYEKAMVSYERFLSTYPDHIMKPSAELGKAYCLEALGRVEESLKEYKAFETGYESHFMKPMAVFGQARSLEQLGRFDEARDVYESFIVDHPDSDWIVHAQSALRFLNMQNRSVNG